MGTEQAPAAHPPCMLVAPYGKEKSDGDGSYFAADPRTSAAGHTSNGHQINATLLPVTPPALSRVCCNFPDAFSTVVTAHDESFLLNIVTKACRRSEQFSDYFVYNAGLASWLPPTLSLLPTCNSTNWGQFHRNRSATGLLRRGESEFVVAELRTTRRFRSPLVPELLLFRSGEWRVKQPRVVHGLHGRVWDLLLSSWEFDAVVPLGDGLLCWVSFDYGILVADVFDERPTLRYVPYPVEYFRYMCIAAGGVVKLLNISDKYCS